MLLPVEEPVLLTICPCVESTACNLLPPAESTFLLATMMKEAGCVVIGSPVVPPTVYNRSKEVCSSTVG